MMNSLQRRINIIWARRHGKIILLILISSRINSTSKLVPKGTAGNGGIDKRGMQKNNAQNDETAMKKHTI